MAPGSRAERREQIRDALLTLIEGMLDDGQSFADISVEHLSAAGGMSRTRFYHYFEDKNDLLHAWFVRISQELAGVADQWWDASGHLSRPQVESLIEETHRAFRPHATLMAAVDAAAVTDSRLRIAVDDAIASDVRALRGHIRRGQSAGEVDPELDADATAQWLTALNWRGRAHLVRGADGAEAARLTAAQASLIWNVLYSGPALASAKQTS